MSAPAKSKSRSSRRPKTNQAASRKLKSLAWLAGTEDWTKSPVYKIASKAAHNVAKGGPLNITGSFSGSTSKRRKLLSVPNETNMVIPAKLSNLSSSQSSAKPQVTTITERMERIGVINSSQTFSNVGQYYINPGLSATFPWLSQIADAYELYSFRKLWFEYRTTSGEVVSGTNPALGKVVLTTNYDPDAPQFTTVVQMENYEGNNNFPPYTSVARHYVDVAGRNMGAVLPYKRRYVRTTVIPTTAPQGGSPDPHAYDVGLFQIGVEGCPDPTADQIGELWVGYSVDLIKPKVTPTTSDDTRFSARYSYSIDGSNHISAVAVSEVYFGNNIPSPTPTISAASLQLNFTPHAIPGNYIVIYRQLPTGSNLLGPPGLNYGSNVVLTPSSTGFRAPLGVTNSTGTAVIYDFIQVTGQPDVGTDFGIALNISGHATVSTAGTLDMILMQCPFPVSLSTGKGVFAKSSIFEDVAKLTKQLELLTTEREEKDDSYSVVSSSLALLRDGKGRVATR